MLPPEWPRQARSSICFGAMLVVGACSEGEPQKSVSDYNPTSSVVRDATEIEVRRILAEDSHLPYIFSADGTLMVQSTAPQFGTYSVEHNVLCIRRGFGHPGTQSSRGTKTEPKCQLVFIGPEGPLFARVDDPATRWDRVALL